jgi:hypothetical protein
MPIRNYGANWDWDPRINSRGMWGKAKGKIVNFYHQIGIYTLQRNDEVLYVGKSHDEKNGMAWRLYDNSQTKPGEWNKFSWFGFRDVNAKTFELIPMDDISMSMSSVISDVEALVIALVRPEWNVTSGAYKHMTEYRQFWPD